jgi:hypothetical protein
MARRQEIVFPWKPFSGAYMAPVPEVAPNSAITLADQMPAQLLEAIPADQRQAYIDQWPMMSAAERQLVRATYGTAPQMVTQRAPQMSAPVLANDISQQTNGTPMQIPADLLSQWWALSPDEQLVVLQTYGVGVPVDIIGAWTGFSPDEKKVVLETYVPGAHVPAAGAPFRGNIASPNLASAAGGNWLLLAGAAFAAWWLLRKK